MSTVEETVEITDQWKHTSVKVKVARPPVTVGDMVTWYREGSPQHPYPAMVQQVNPHNIAVMLLCTDWPFRVIDSVLHCDDPRLQENKAIKLNSGSWDYTAQAKKLQTSINVLNEKLAAQNRRLDELEDSLSKPETKGKK